jgi:hypothetical protein
MGCSGKTARSALPIINSQVKVSTVKPVQRKKRAIVDFHCPQCGTTKANYPNYRHKCTGPQPVAYQIARASKCEACPQNRDGVCLPLLAMQPDKPCLVEIGVAMPGVTCPIGKWPRVLFRCDKCGSVRFDASGLIVCPTCRQR